MILRLSDVAIPILMSICGFTSLTLSSVKVMQNAAPVLIEGIGLAPDQVVAGTDVLINWHIHKRTDCPGQNARVFQGAKGFIHRQAMGETRLPKTDAVQVYSIQTRIPDDAPPGLLLLTIEGAYTCPDEDPVPFTLGPVTMTVVPAETERSSP